MSNFFRSSRCSKRNQNLISCLLSKNSGIFLSDPAPLVNSGFLSQVVVSCAKYPARAIPFPGKTFFPIGFIFLNPMTKAVLMNFKFLIDFFDRITFPHDEGYSAQLKLFIKFFP